MFTSIESFTQQWKNESAATLRVLETLTDESLSQAVTNDHRTLGRLAWHITTTLEEMPSLTGLQLPSLGDHNEAPASAKAIADAYRHSSEALLEALRTQWTDETLQQTSNMYGEQWPNGVTLLVLINHEIHHRGQMTVLMRQAGLRVPDIYGPAKEDWANMGMQPPVV